MSNEVFQSINTFISQIPSVSAIENCVHFSVERALNVFYDGTGIEYTEAVLSAYGIEFPDTRPPAISSVVLDAEPATRLNNEIRAEIASELMQIWSDLSESIEGKSTKSIWEYTSELSPHLKSLLSQSLIAAASSGTRVPIGHYQVQVLPFDFIASAKALFCAVTFADNSRDMRQGAVRVSDGTRELIVGTSGLDSIDDEAVSLEVGALGLIIPDLYVDLSDSDTSHLGLQAPVLKIQNS